MPIYTNLILRVAKIPYFNYRIKRECVSFMFGLVHSLNDFNTPVIEKIKPSLTGQ